MDHTITLSHACIAVALEKAETLYDAEVSGGADERDPSFDVEMGSELSQSPPDEMLSSDERKWVQLKKHDELRADEDDPNYIVRQYVYRVCPLSTRSC